MKTFETKQLGVWYNGCIDLLFSQHVVLHILYLMFFVIGIQPFKRDLGEIQQGTFIYLLGPEFFIKGPVNC